MAKNNVGQWDATAANNTDVGGINIAEGCPPSNVNDAMREMMAQLKASPAGLTAQTSATDTTTDRLLKVGAFGLGVQVVETETDLDNYKEGGAFITPATGVTNLPSGWNQGRNVIFVGGGSTYTSQTIAGAGANEGLVAHRSWDGSAWQPWRQLAFTDDTQPLDAQLTALAGLTGSAGSFVRWTGAATAAMQAISGTVSQSGGTPTGAIIEYGSNANGNYVRFADGTQIAWRNVGTASNSNAFTFPAAFASAPVVTWSYNSTGSRFIASSSISSTSVQVFVADITGTPSSVGGAQFMAIGRWY